MRFLKIYKEEFHSKIKSDLKKIDKKVVKQIKDIHLDNILKNPFEYNKLKGELSNFYSYHFRENKVDYRIAYKIVDNDRVVFYYMIAKRENFYKNIYTRS